MPNAERTDERQAFSRVAGMSMNMARCPEDPRKIETGLSHLRHPWLSRLDGKSMK
jgi:hypothetical protein